MDGAFDVSRFEDAVRIKGTTRASLAEAVGVSAARLSQFSDRPPDARLVDHLAVELGVRPEFFFRQPLLPTTEPFFRRLSRTPASVRERYRRLAQLFGEAMRAGGIEMHGAVPDLSDLPPAAAATAFRAELGLQPDEALPSTVRLLEVRGVAVHELAVADDDLVDAFCSWVDGIPIVFLNPVKADPYRSRHNAGHELRHLSAHARPADGDARKEQEDDANEFAGELLLSHAMWRELAPTRGLSNPWTYLEAKGTYGISVKSLMWKSRAAGLLSDSEYRYACMRYSSMGWNSGEEMPEFDATDVRDRPLTSDRILAAFGSVSAVADALAITPEMAATTFGWAHQRPTLRVVK